MQGKGRWWGRDRKDGVTEPTPACIPSRSPTVSFQALLDFITSLRTLSQKGLNGANANSDP